ncbi:MAG TPA: ATP-binding protein [Pelobium sp.]|nr:ATP-binding protein [Pelobium sp.]
MEKAPEDVVGAIIIASIVLVILAVFTLLFFLLYIKKKLNLKQANENLKIAFQQELLQTQIEIQEETFNHISEEIHDNIGQVLSFLKLNLSLRDGLSRSELEEKISSSAELVAAVIKDVRNLSKSLSYDYIKQFGLNEALKNELNKMNLTGVYETFYTVKGEAFVFSEQINLLVFRIFQESLNNILKHADAHQIIVKALYTQDSMVLEIKDDGRGFLIDTGGEQYGSGLKNIKKRANILNAIVDVHSILNSGTTITLTVPIKTTYEKN